MNTFTEIFLIALALTTVLRVWLAMRQIRHVRRHRERVPADFAEQISPAQHRLAADYTVAKSRLSLAQIALEAVVLSSFTVFGGVAWLARYWNQHITGTITANVILIASVIVVSGVVELPLEWYRKFRLEQRFGFNTMTLQRFAGDLLMQAAIGLLLGLPLLYAVFWILQATGPDWWLYAWLVWVGFNLFILAIYPNFIAPLFNRFEPLPEGELKQHISNLLKKCGFAAQGLFVMDGSKRSRHGNAYFTGFGRSKRIVLFDTLIKHLQTGEIEAVLAHELGHFYHRHVLKRMVWVFGMSLVFLAVIAVLLRSPWFFSAFGVRSMSAGAGFVLFFLILPVFTLPLQMLSGMYSRRQEFEADQYAAKFADPDRLVSALIKLYRDNATTLTPDRWYSMFYDSHPNAQQRVARLSASVHN
ncbi:MAG TPA: M48 family metallopeptidase [Burkholderiales bacterium]|nr:M48 family metallopeptidase [Burkholderiales bacterium]